MGKSSVLRRLREELARRRPELRPVQLDLLGIREPRRFAVHLADKLGLEAPKPTADARALAEEIGLLLRRHFSPEAPGVLLIDEADGLVESDAKDDFPLLSKLRSLQAEGVCSFVLTGYWYLYRHTLSHASPLYNFAPVRRLGPLDPRDGRDLAGLAYADETLPELPFVRVKPGFYPRWKRCAAGRRSTSSTGRRAGAPPSIPSSSTNVSHRGRSSNARVMKTLRATFSLDAETADVIQRLAMAWGISKSAVVRKAVEELDARRDLLTEKERLRLLGTLDRWLATDVTRPRSEALAEIEEVREARRGLS